MNYPAACCGVIHLPTEQKLRHNRRAHLCPRYPYLPLHQVPPASLWDHHEPLSLLWRDIWHW